ncbi:MAG: hypothetical protein ABSF29_16235, partial [Tepidisphaeraceae bacterium]
MHWLFVRMKNMKMCRAILLGVFVCVVSPGRAMAFGGDDCRKMGQAVFSGVLEKWWDWPLAEQKRRWGLLLPEKVDANRPLVILVHGLDGDEETCWALQGLLQGDGWQTAIFCYPSEEPIAKSAALLRTNCIALRETFPKMKIEMVTESMGGLVAREYVEGEGYAG